VDANSSVMCLDLFQLMEELESLEETLNESIRESLGARTGKSTSKKKPVFEDEEDENDRY
jgi:hypothetical protein